MNINVQRPTEEQLSAWVDGELDAEQSARVQAWIDSHGDDAELVARWAADRDALRELFAPAAQEALPAALRDIVVPPATPARWQQAAAAVGLLLLGGLAGAGLGWQAQAPGRAELARLRTQVAVGTAQGWVQRAALAHSVYVGEPRHAVEVKAQEEHLARWLTRRIDVPVKLFDLRAHGFELVGGRLLPDGPGKSAQLLYQDTQGLRVTVYLRRPEQGAQTAFRFERQGELGLFYWVEEGAGYALVGALPRETLLALAQSIYQQLPTPAAAPAAPASAAPGARAPAS